MLQLRNAQCVYGASLHRGRLSVVWWPWKLLRKIVWRILFSTKDHNYESKMFSDIKKKTCFWYNHPCIAVHQSHDFSWNPYGWWRHHPFMTSLLLSWWCHMTLFNLIWFGLPFSMIQPSLITNRTFSSLYGPTPWSREFVDSRFQGHNTK